MRKGLGKVGRIHIDFYMYDIKWMLPPYPLPFQLNAHGQKVIFKGQYKVHVAIFLLLFIEYTYLELHEGDVASRTESKNKSITF